MKYLRTYDELDTKEINKFNLWTGRDFFVEDQDNYYLNLENIWLPNKISLLNKNLKGEIIKFHCLSDMKKEQLKVKRLDLISNELIVIDTNGASHAVDTNQTIIIPKIYIAAKQYNL